MTDYLDWREVMRRRQQQRELRRKLAIENEREQAKQLRETRINPHDRSMNRFRYRLPRGLRGS